jgi:hypothetical protein
MKRTCIVLALIACVGCGAPAKQASNMPVTGTNIPAGTWVVTINNFIGGQTDTVTAVNPYSNGTLVYDGAGPAVGYTPCDNTGLTYYNPPQTGGTPVVGPACFVNLGYGCSGGCGSTPQSITSTNPDEVGDFIISVPLNPAPNGSTFISRHAYTRARRKNAPTSWPPPKVMEVRACGACS